MSTSILYLISFRQAASQRAHFAIWAPHDYETPGTLIHVVGAPMAGFQLEFKRDWHPKDTQQKIEVFQIGQINTHHISGATGGRSKDSIPRGSLETVASQIMPPRISENFRAPVNETTNRRCQEWTMDFVRRLVSLQYIDRTAETIVQSKRDSPTHGIVGLIVGAGAAQYQPQPQQPQQPQQNQQTEQPQQLQQLQQEGAAASSTDWVWDENYRRYRRLERGEWVWQQ